MAKRLCFCQILTEDEKTCFLLSELTDDGKDGISLTVATGQNAWSGQLSGDDLESMSQVVQMKFSDYVKETVNALTRHHGSVFTFQYQLAESEKGIAEFSWKRCAALEDIKILLGKIKLVKVKKLHSVTEQIFVRCLDTEKRLTDRITSLEADNSRLSTERDTALRRYEKVVKEKETMEQDLYVKFVAILNSKKSKLRDLKAQLDNVSSNQPPSVPSPSKVSNEKNASDGTKASGKQCREQQSESHRAESTDEDADKTPSPPRRAKKSRLNKDKDNNSQLILSDDKEDDDDDKPRILSRRRAVQKNVTPSKLTLPRVSSAAKSRPESIGKSRLHKSTSATQKSSDHDDADDLLGDL